MTLAFETCCLFLKESAHTLTELPRSCVGNFYGCLRRGSNAFVTSVAVKADLKMSDFGLRIFPEWLQLILLS